MNSITGLRAARLLALAATALCTALLALVPAGAAQAAPVTVAGPGSGAGQVSLPVGVAVDPASGDLFVADANNFRIDKFDTEGNFLLAWGWGVADGTSQALQVCGPTAEPPTKRCFKAAREGLSVAKGPGAVGPQAVVVDAIGDVYVADVGKHRVTKFGPSGEFIFMVGKGVDQGGGTPAHPGNICTAEYLADGDVCGAGASGSGPDEFTKPYSLAVDSSGHVWVGDSNRLTSFDSTGAPGAEIALPGAGDTKSLALDPEDDFYLKSTSVPGVRKLEAGTGIPLGTFDEAGLPVTVAVDADDHVYIGDRTNPYRFKVYDGESGEQLSQFGAGQVIGEPGVETLEGNNAIAVGEAAGALYTATSLVVQAFPIPAPGPLTEGQHTEALLPSSVTLAATLNPEGASTEYRFEYGTSSFYGSETEAKTLAAAGFEEEAVAAELSRLIPGTTYHFRLVASNEGGKTEGPDVTFVTRPAVAIDAQWASDLAARSASLHAELDPLGVAGEWWIEYGTSPCSKGGCAETDHTALPASFGDLAVGAAFSGLEPATTYYYRFAASDKRDNVPYTVHGEDRSFTTQLAALGFALPDSRAWEMVTPPQKFGGKVGAPFDGEGQAQAAADGEALAYLSIGSIEALPEGNRASEFSSVLARRGPGGAWGSRDITPPHTSVTPVAVGHGDEYKLFAGNLDLAEGLLEPRDTTPLSPQASERTPYLRHNTEPPVYEPLVSAANALPGFGGDPAKFFGEVAIRGASADLSRVLVRSCVPLVKGAANGALYERVLGVPSAQQILPVSELPEGQGGGVVSGEPGSGQGSTHNAVSADGLRVFWMTGKLPLECGVDEPGLYLRDTERAETVRLDAVQGGFGTGAADPLFLGASAAGTVAFFTDTQGLTEDASEAGADLYRCAVVVEGGELRCELTDLTPGFEESAEVLGLAAGMSEDGSRVYFVARGALADENVEGASPVPGQPNLYLWEAGEGTRLVATLSEEDAHDWGFSPENPFQAFKQTAAASPSGRYLAFMSQRSLTGYDNRDARSGEADQEVFRYDAQGNGGAGQLICASCNPSGQRPAGLRGGEEVLALEFDPQELWKGRGVAAVLPEATKAENNGASLYRSRSVHDNGRLFFNAADSLVAADSNGNGDVYQYEDTATGDCGPSAASPATALVAGGCVSLISSGTAEGTSAFIDADVSGDNVFFYSPAQLSVTDEDQVTDIYDARVGGEPAVLSPNAECLGEACQPAAAAPNDLTPASSAFRGPGNLRSEAARKRCPKGRREARPKGKARCAKPGHRTRHHRRKHRNGRAGR